MRSQATDTTTTQPARSDLFSRPRTRSQTGSTTKRNRVPSDSLKHQAPRKKPRPASESSSPAVETENVPRRVRTESPIPLSTDVSQSTTRSSSPLVSTPPLTFLESSASPGYAPERRGPRARATLPVPVPNLTKKSRGRRVPTQEAAEVQGEPKDKRTYVCKVEGCGKCFHRGEHLKRHIRSIHTHEKPFECTHPSCGKFFNRHDNLLQHLKVHKQNSEEDSSNPRPILNLSPPSPSPSPEPEPAMDSQVESSASESEEVSPTIPVKPKYPVSYSPYTRFDISCESYNPASMMAISSLRTELPSHSLPTSRIRDSF